VMLPSVMASDPAHDPNALPVEALKNSLRACRRAMARRLWQLAYLGLSGHAVRVVRFRTSNVEYRCSPVLYICGCECCACVLCVCRRVRVLFRVCARVNVRDHVCVHASSCYGHVCAVRVAGFRTSNVEYSCSAALRMCGWEYCV
jgi:hypothetical protein